MINYFDKISTRVKIVAGSLGFFIFSCLLTIENTPSHCDKNSYEKIKHGIKVAILPKQEQAVYLDIPFKSLESIKKERINALSDGVLTKSKFVSATFRFENEESAVKIRLKGDFVDHLEKMPWSLRLEMKDATFNGMKVFSLQRPAVRGGLVEPIFMAEARELGLLAPRYGFVHLYINGEDMGVVAFEEHMGKEMLEANGRKEGPILALNDDDGWEYLRINNNRNEVNPYQNMNIVSTKYFNKKKIDDNPKFSRQANFAINQIEDYQNGRSSFSQVFDVEKMYLAVVLSDAWATSHPISWPNIKFYLNPFTLKLEPVLFDNGHQPEFVEHSYNINNIYSVFGMEIGKNMDKKLLEESVRKVSMFDSKWYEEKLNQYSDSIDIDSKNCMNFDYTDITRNKKRMEMDRNYFNFNPKVIDDFYISEIYRKSMDYVNNRFFSKHVEANVDSNGYIVVKNYTPLELDWMGVEIICKDESGILSVNKKIPPTKLMFGMGKAEYNIKSNINKCGVGNLNAIKVITKLNDQFLTSNVGLRRFIVSDIENPLGHVSEYLPNFFKLVKDGYVVQSGRWKINESISIPKGKSLTLEQGVNITFAPNASLTINGPVFINGTKLNPVVLNGAEGGAWRGIYVYNSKRESKIRNLNISNIGVVNDILLSLTGALTFYESDVDFCDVSIDGVYSEDAVNIVRSKFNIQNMSVIHTKSDAIDSDFSVGYIAGSIFNQIGGDAIDASGSLINMSGIKISNVKDKAFSIGENSEAWIDGAHVDSVGTVVAVKDGSRAKVESIEILEPYENTFMAYRKKSEYGASQLEVFAPDEFRSKSAVQSGNQIVFNGISLSPEKLNVKKLYSTGSMRK